MSDPKEIWLEPDCGDTGDRTWCQDDVYDTCGECGKTPTKYVLASELEKLQAELAALKSGAKRQSLSLKYANEMVVKYRREWAEKVTELAALKAKAAVPDGWKLVPKKPTPEMRTAAIGVEIYADSPALADCLTWAEAEAIYTGMLAAAPSQPHTPILVSNRAEIDEALDAIDARLNEAQPQSDAVIVLREWQEQVEAYMKAIADSRIVFADDEGKPSDVLEYIEAVHATRMAAQTGSAKGGE